MTDSRLQELKRAWEASGSVEDEAAYLQERLRVGDLTQERLNFAILCGYQGLETQADHPPKKKRRWFRRKEPVAEVNIEFWFDSLPKWDETLGVRAAMIAVESVLEFWEEARPKDMTPHHVVKATREWLDDPCDATQEAACSAALAAGQVGHDLTSGNKVTEQLEAVAFAADTLGYSTKFPNTVAAVANRVAYVLGYGSPRAEAEVVARMKRGLADWVLGRTLPE